MKNSDSIDNMKYRKEYPFYYYLGFCVGFTQGFLQVLFQKIKSFLGYITGE